MNLPIIIHKDENTGYGVTVPDLAGCFSYGDTLDEAIANAHEAALFHIDGMIADNGFQPITPSNLAQIQQDNPTAILAVISLDEAQFTKQVRFNVSWNEYLLNRVDEYVAAHHDTRSGFLAKAAIAALERPNP